MRVVLIGANGQVGAEVALLLAANPEIDLRPLVRSRSGSAFLRFQGIPVMHASIADPANAAKALFGADVIANFALAGGTPHAALRQNEELIHAVFEHSPQTATIVFFSTLAVHGSFDQSGPRARTAYGDLKIRNERLVTSLAKKHRRRSYVLRLGHVAGIYQNITATIHRDILSPPVPIPYPDRDANVTHTVTIADALLAVGSGRAGAPGLYDLVDVPQWTWRQVYEKEAAHLGVPLRLRELIPANPISPQGAFLSLKRTAFDTIKRIGLREPLTKILSNLPGSINEIVKAEFNVNRAREEIAALKQPQNVCNPAMYWPAIEVRKLDGLTRTQDLFQKTISTVESKPNLAWPADLLDWLGGETPHHHI